jgi:hypothetical protein
MATRFRVCPHCKGKFDRRTEGKCPLCMQDVSCYSERQCPACQFYFRMSKRIDGKPHCPNPDCRVELYYPQGKTMLGQTILAADKDTSVKVVEMLEQHISIRNINLIGEPVVFVFEGSERNIEIKHAYALLDRSKTFLKRNNCDWSPHEFTIEVMEHILADKWYAENLVTLKQLRNDISKIGMDVYRVKKRNARINESQRQTYIDYKAFIPAWD